jgi:amino acid transporter
MTLSNSASTVFTWLQDIVAIATLVNWMTICTVYLRFHYGCKKQGIDRHTELPWAAPLQPYSTWFSLIVFTILFLTGGYSTFIHNHWDTETFVSSYLNLPAIIILYFGYKYIKKTKIVPLEEIPIRPFIEHYRRNPEPLPPAKRGLQKINILWS